jgi:hypothetical protein
VQNLPLEVRLVHDIKIDDTDPADPCGCEVERQGRTEAPRPHQQDTCGFQFHLPFEAHFRQYEMAAIPPDLFAREADIRF